MSLPRSARPFSPRAKRRRSNGSLNGAFRPSRRASERDSPPQAPLICDKALKPMAMPLWLGLEGAHADPANPVPCICRCSDALRMPLAACAFRPGAGGARGVGTRRADGLELQESEPGAAAAHDPLLELREPKAPRGIS